MVYKLSKVWRIKGYNSKIFMCDVYFIVRKFIRVKLFFLKEVNVSII